MTCAASAFQLVLSSFFCVLFCFSVLPHTWLTTNRAGSMWNRMNGIDSTNKTKLKHRLHSLNERKYVQENENARESEQTSEWVRERVSKRSENIGSVKENKPRIYEYRMSLNMCLLTFFWFFFFANFNNIVRSEPFDGYEQDSTNWSHSIICATYFQMKRKLLSVLTSNFDKSLLFYAVKNTHTVIVHWCDFRSDVT